MPGRTISGKAVASLVLATLSCCLWPFASIPALAAGVAALVVAVLGLRDVRRSQGRLKGGPLAVAGIVAEAATMLVFLLLVPTVHRVREAAQRMTST